MAAAQQPRALLTLAFEDRELEQSFLDEHGREVVPLMRFMLAAGVLLYMVFGVLDAFIAPNDFGSLWTIRFGMVVPLILACLVLSYVRPYSKALQPLVAVTVALAGCGISAMVAVLPLPMADDYYAGLILVVFYASGTTILRFKQALLVVLAVILSYQVVALWIQARPWLVVLNNDFFLIASGFIGAFAAYIVERIRRHNFLQRRIILEDRAMLKEMNARLEQAATTDPLTGLRNRRLLDEKLQHALDLHDRYEVDTSLVLVDLDNFKRVNDTLGHTTGDDLLRQFAELLEGLLRATDSAYRYGGDEFLVLLPKTNVEGAYNFAARLQEEARRITSVPRLRHLDLGTSIGVAPASAAVGRGELMDLLNLVDDALYQAKRAGKGCIKVLDEQGEPTDPGRKSG